MKKKLLLLIVALPAIISMSFSQTYTTGASNWTTTFASNGASFDFTNGVALFSFSTTGGDGATSARFITTDGTAVSAGNSKITSLKPGQKLTIKIAGQDGGGVRTGITTGGRIGIALRNSSSLFEDGGTTNVFNRYASGALTRVEFVGGSSTATFINSTGSSNANMPSFATFKSGVTYEIEIVSDKEFNIVVGGTRNNIQLLAGSGTLIFPNQITITNISANMDGLYTNLAVSNIPVTVTANTGETFTVTGAITDNGGIANTVQKNGVGTVVLTGANTYTGTTTVSAGTLQLNSSGGTTIPSTNDITVSGGTLQVSTNQTLNNITLSSGTLTVDAGVTLFINGTLTYSGGTISGAGTIVYGASGAIIYSATKTTDIEWTASNTPANVSITAGTLTLGNNVTTTGNITIIGTGVLAANTRTINIGGNWTNYGTAGFTESTSTVNFNGTGSQAITTTGGEDFYALTKSTTNSLTQSSNVTVANILSIVAGTLTTGANNLSFGGSASATIGATAVLSINGGITDFNNRPVTLQSNSITNGGAIGTITGTLSNATNVTIQRYTQAQRGYRTLAHPYTTTQTVRQLIDNFQITGLSTTTGSLTGTYGTASGNPSIFYYDGTKPALTSSVLGPIYSADSLSWPVGIGLYAFLRGNGNEGNAGVYTQGTINGITQPGGISPVTLDVTSGSINQGDKIVTLTTYGVGKDNFTLVGNPYPCPVNLSGVTNITSFGIIYLQNPTYTAGTTTTVRGGFENTSSKNIVIPSMGCFYIQSTAATPTSITFHETDKVATGTSTYNVFGTGTTKPTIGLEINTTDGFMDRTKISFDNSSTSAATDFYDGIKLSNSLITFYSLSSEKKALGIDYRSDAMFDSIIPLGIKTNVNRTYTISLSELTDLPYSQLVLRDKLLNTETKLVAVGDSYSFSITADAATQGNNRFEIGLLTTTVLPTRLTSFTAQLQTSKTIAVNWVSTSEVNADYYQVQRSTNGSSFTSIGKVAAKGAGNYTYNDDLSTITPQPSTIYYRLQMVDKDGSVAYSKVVNVQLATANKVLSIYPNPVQATLFAQVTAGKAGKVTMVVTDMQGKQLRSQTAAVNAGITALSIDANGLAAGSYVLVVTDSDGEQQKQQFVKQ